MKNKILFLFVSISFLTFKASAQIDTAIIFSEIRNLKTVEEKQIYLENIVKLDQEIRKVESDVSIAFSKNSEQYCNVSSEMMLIDIVNFKKIIYYIEYCGYPSVLLFGQKANLAPWLIIHHNAGMPFKYIGYKKLKEGWKDGMCSDEHFEFYLNRLLSSYFKKNGIDGSSKTIDELIKFSDNLFSF